jgi:hypothetical protein
MSIRINATVSEARAAAGHSKEQWDRFYVSFEARKAGRDELTVGVHYKRRGQATFRGASGLDEMDTHPRERERVDAAANKRSIDGGRDTGG